MNRENILEYFKKCEVLLKDYFLGKSDAEIIKELFEKGFDSIYYYLDKKIHNLDEPVDIYGAIIYFLYNLSDEEKLKVINVEEDQEKEFFCVNLIKDMDIKFNLLDKYKNKHIDLSDFDFFRIIYLAASFENPENAYNLLMHEIDIFNAIELSNVLTFFPDEYKTRFIDDNIYKTENSSLFEELISYIEDDKIKYKYYDVYLKQFNKEYSQNIISSFKNDDIKEMIINNTNIDFDDVENIIGSYKNFDKICDYIEKSNKKSDFFNELYFIGFRIEDDDIKLKLYFKYNNIIEDPNDVIYKLYKDENKIKMINYFYEKGKAGDDLYNNPSSYFDWINSLNNNDKRCEEFDYCLSMFGEKIKDRLYELKENDIEKYNKIIKELLLLKYNNFAKIFNYYDNNINKLESLDSFEKSIDIMNKINNSNSSEITHISTELISLILEYPIEEWENVLERIEDIFLKNNLPYVGKVFKVFEMMHPDYYVKNTYSPNINKKHNPTYRKIILFNDILKCAIGSNNKSLIQYIENIEQGNNILNNLVTGKININNLNDNEEEEFISYIKHMNTLYNNTEYGKKNPRSLSNNIVKDSYELLSLFLKQERENFKVDELPNRIVKMFCHFSGIDTLNELKQQINTKVIEADKRNRERALNNDFKIEIGDYFKNLAYDDYKYGENYYTYFINILKNGSLCREFLGSSAGSDATPLDTDLSRINKEFDLSNSPFLDSDYEAGGEGPLWLVMKDDKNRLNYSNETKIYDPNKIEIYKINSDTHYCARGGIPMCDISGFVVNESLVKLYRLEYSIIMESNFYIPIYNTNSQLIFRPEQYDLMKKDLYGLKYYNTEDLYEFAEELDNFDVKKYSNIDVNNNREIANNKRNLVINELCSAGLNIINKRDPYMRHGLIELLDTGSTGRGTNSSDDYDFDFIMRIDKDIYFDEEKLNKIKEKIEKAFPEVEFSDKYNIREQYVKINGENIKLDISILVKDDKLSYTTDECIKDRLNCIEEKDPDKYKKVLENIIFAKELLKNGECYKPKHAGNGHAQGGLGGVGVENWILQHGGSLENAAKSFLEVADNSKDFVDFSSKYHVFDFGENHMYFRHDDKYMHDEFVSNNMNESGYEKMKGVLKKFINKLEEDKAIKKSGKQI